MAKLHIPKGFKPTATAFSVGAPGGTQETDVEGGAGRSGMVFARGPQPFRVQMVLNSLQLGVWTAFLHLLIGKGASTFVMPINSGMGLADHDCTISPGTYGTTPMGGDLTSVTFEVKATSNVYEMTKADALNLYELYEEVGDDLGALLDAINRFANIDTRVLDF